MKIGVLSDIHSNEYAFRACLDHMEQEGVEEYILLGDFVSDLPYPQRTMRMLYQLLEEKKCHVLRGNREEYLLEQKRVWDGLQEGIKWLPNSASGNLLYTLERLTQRDFDFFASLPNTFVYEKEGYPSIRCCHGSPENSRELLQLQGEPVHGWLQKIPEAYLLCAHTHFPGSEVYQGKVYMNAGCVGIAIKDYGYAQCMILQDELNHGKREWVPSFLKIPYDTRPLIRDVYASGLHKMGKWFINANLEILQTGVDHAADLVALAMENMEKATGKRAVWPKIDEIYFKQAAASLGIPDYQDETGISNLGDCIRIQKVMRRAMEGEAITIGFLGGSITQGCLASKPELCYAYRVFQWWEKAFPKAKIRYVNAGIGATDSQFGCARVFEDLLQYEPDFVIVEYSVNDENTPHFMETYEGVVRRILKESGDIAVMLVHNVFYDSGLNAEEIHGQIARHYDLPAVSMRTGIYPRVVSGELVKRALTQDDLHPNDYGHELVAEVILGRLQQIQHDGLFATDEMLSSYGDKELPDALTANRYEQSIRYQAKNCTPLLKGFSQDTDEQKGITDIFKKGWIATEKGSKFSLMVQGTCIAVQYRKTVFQPAPIARLTLDGDERNAILLDANFTETWGDKMVLETVLEQGESGEHLVEIELIETHEKDVLPFYLVSVIGS